MLISLDDVLAARSELGNGPCAEGVEWFKEHWPNGVEVRGGLVVVPPEIQTDVDSIFYVRWLVEALKPEIEVVLGSRLSANGYLMKPGGIGKPCDYEEYRRLYEGEGV